MDISTSTPDVSESASPHDSRQPSKNFDSFDMSVVAVYFVLVLAIGFYSMFRSNRGTVSGYFLAGRFMTWLPVGASMFASNIGSEHFIGLAGSGAASGISVGAFELNAMIIAQLTGWVFLPVFIASKVCTLPEYMQKRFGGNRIRTYLAILSLTLYIFTKISVNLFSGALFLQQAMEWNLYSAITLLLALTAACTITGGLAAVMYMDTLQCGVMICGAAIVAVKAFIMVDGYSGLREKFALAIPSVSVNMSNCGLPEKENAWRMLRSWDDPNLPWLGFIFGQTPASIWYWCTDQVMVQRLLAAKSLSHAQGGTIFAGLMKILPLFLIVMPGMISRVLFPDEVGCVVPEECEKYCGNRAGCSNIAYPRLVLEVMPSGLRGLMMSVMLAALMSDLTSVYNSASTLFTMDIWPQIRKQPTVLELMIVGRAFALAMVIISIGWIPIIQSLQGGQLYIYIQSIAAYLSPPIAAVYLLAILWKRMNEKGAFWAMILGFVVGVTRMILEFSYMQPECGEIDTRPIIIAKVHYMYFATFLFAVTLISGVVISLMTDKVEPFMLIRATYWTRFDESDRDDEKTKFEMHVDEPPSRKENPQGDEIELNDVSVKVGHTTKPIRHCKSSRIARGLMKGCIWFCGFHQRPEHEEPSNQLNRVDSLQQTKKEKLVLSVFLCIILIIPVVLYTYYSVDW